jgi:NDP-sugar pyrophosphorylase family protein
VYAFDPSIFAAIRQTESYGEKALTDTLSTQLDDHRIRAVRYRGRWLDVSEPWDLLTVNNALIRDQPPDQPQNTAIDDSAVVADATVLGDGVVVQPQAAVLGSVTLGDNVTVGAGAIVENSIVLPDSTVESGAIVNDCIVGANTTIGPNTTIEGGTADVVLDETVYQDVRFGGLTGDNATIGANVTVTPGAIIGNGAIVDSATRVTGRIEDDTHVTRG